MSGAIGGADTLGLTPFRLVVGNALQTKAALDQLAGQASSGLVSTTYGGLGAEAASTVLTISPQIAEIGATVDTLNATTGRMSVQGDAFTEINTLVTNVVSSIATLTSGTTGTAAFQATVTDAQQALTQVASLLNATDGGVYVFGGQDSAAPPVPQAGAFLSTGFCAQIGTAVSSLGTSGAAGALSAVMGIAGSTAAGTSPFAAGLQGAGLSRVQTEPGQAQGAETVTGISADSNAFVSSSGVNTTGSYMRDILGALAAIGSLTPGDASAAGFGDFMQSIQGVLQGATATMNQDAGVLGANQAAITAKVSSLQNVSTALTGQVSSADAVDMAATLSKLSAVQASLQGSYQLIAAMNSLSLTTYLSA